MHGNSFGYIGLKTTSMHKTIPQSVVRIILLAFVLLSGLTPMQRAKAQRVALKSNVLYDAALSPNLGGEFLLSRRFSLEVNVVANPFRKERLYANFLGFQAEGRFYPERAMVRHFVGLMAFAEVHDILRKGTRDAGDALAIGPVYGYAYPLSRHWNVEAEIGLGVIRCRDFKWMKGTERAEEPNNSKTMLGPIKLGVTFAYIIR